MAAPSDTRDTGCGRARWLRVKDGSTHARLQVLQISFCRIRIEPFSSYALLSMSFLAASRISSRFFETDYIGSDADARNLFLRTSIEILHSTRFPPT